MNAKYKVIRRNSIIFLIVVIAIAGGYSFFSRPAESTIVLQTVQLSKKDITTTVTATGTVEPVDQVEVGTQVSGIINHIYVDYNSEVKKGELLAELDKTNLQESVNNAQAQFNAAQNELNYYHQNYERQKNMFQSGVISKAEYEQAEYQVNNAKQTLNQRQTALAQANTNLSYANIYAPINGIILSREVEEGQTVAASMTTPTLFTIAKDITKMQVEADVDEADIGNVKDGQRVIFTVDAYPMQEFSGKVRQVRLSPTIESNVVTYTVIIDADNPEQKLKPGLTATVIIYTQELNGASTLPVSATNFAPDATLLQAYYLQIEVDTEIPEGKVSSQQAKYVWVKNNDGTLIQKQITVGINDGINVEIKEGVGSTDLIIIGMEKTDKNVVKSKSGEESPFMQKPPSRTNTKGKAA